MKKFFIQLITFISFFFFSIPNPVKEIPKNLSSNIVEDMKKLLFILPEDKTVSFNNSLINVTLYNTSDKSFSYYKMNINFENCLTILQKVYDLDPFFDYNNQNSNEVYKRCFFIIIKIEIDRKLVKYNTSFINTNNNVSIRISFDEGGNKTSLVNNNSITKRPTNHIEYLVFNGKNGKLLNTSYCNDLNVKILHPIVEQDIIDLNSSKQFYEEYKIDVFRTNDSFFNDICMNFTSEKKKDMTLSLKRQYFYQNVSFCDANCTYIEVNYTSNTAVCACEVNGIMNDEKLLVNNNINDRTFTYNDIISVINYKIFKCYKQVFDFKRLSVNAGNYLSFFLLLIYTICIVNFYKNRKKNVMEYFQKIKSKLETENKKKSIRNNDKKSSNNSDNGSEKNMINKNCSNSESNYQKENDSDDSNNFEEDQKEENTNKSDNINIIDISVKDIAGNPPLKKNKLKLKINPKDVPKNELEKKKKMKKIKYILNLNNSATKDTYNYGEIKLDTANELIESKNNIENENIERNWGEIITIKKVIKNEPKNTNSILSSTKNNTSKSKTKKSSDISNLNKTNTSNNNDNNEQTKNNRYDNLNDIFPNNFSVEIPISNIVPSFLKSKNQLLNVNNLNIQNLNLNSRNSRNINVLNVSKDLRSSQNSLNTFIFKRTKTKTNNAVHNNFISKHDHDLISDKEEKKSNIVNKDNNIFNKKGFNNIHKSTLRRTKEIEAPKKKKDKKKESNSERKNFFADFDEMKFEIAILIDNRNFCEKFVCELKEKCIVILLLFRKDVIFKQIELSLFVLSCTLDYFFNAFLYSDIYLKEEYEQEDLIRILIDYPKEIFSSLAAQFIVRLIEFLMEERAFSLFLKRVAVSNRNYLKAINFLLKKYEKRFRLYIIIGYIFLFVTWYYTSAFCTVYQNSQLNLLYDTLESLGLNILLPLPLSFLSIVCRHFAILRLNKFLFFISNIIRIFA